MRKDIYDIAKHGTEARPAHGHGALRPAGDRGTGPENEGLGHHARVALHRRLDRRAAQQLPARRGRLRERDEGHRELQEGGPRVPGEHDHHQAQREGPAQAARDGDQARRGRLSSVPARAHGPRQGTDRPGDPARGVREHAQVVLRDARQVAHPVQADLRAALLPHLPAGREGKGQDGHARDPTGSTP